jgi:hypothetical protein
MQQPVSQFERTVRLALYGSSASCLTYNALRIAFGLCGDWWKIAVIDTTGCASRYCHLGMFTTIGLSAPYQPQRYYDAMELCEAAGMEVVILNTISPAYNGQGGVLDQLNEGAYETALRAHRALFGSIRYRPYHVICTATTKARLSRKGKGLSIVQQPVQQEGVEQYFDTVLQLDRSNGATVVKDLSSLLPLKQSFPVSADIGTQLKRWCMGGGAVVSEELQHRINSCNTLGSLYQLLFETSTEDPQTIAAFTRRRLQLESGHRELAEALVDLPF